MAWLNLLIVTCLVHPSLTSILHFVILPNAIRVETDEIVTLTSLESAGDVMFTVYLQDYPAKTKTFSETNITVPDGEIRNVTVRMHVSDLSESPQSPEFVNLVVETVGLTPHFKKEATLLVNDRPGFIFIQTDKPLYTPDQSILSRVIALDEMFRPVDWPLQIDILNPEGMTISRRVVDNKGLMVKDSLKIPENPIYGNWTVTAKFTNGLKTKAAVRVEVKEYVLPTFAMTFHIPEEQRVILPNATSCSIAVGARYMYGKPVKGHLTVTYGLLWHGHVFTVGKERNLQLNESGYAESRISTEELRLPVESVWFPNGGKLHVQAAVTEAASGRVERADDVSIVFSDHLYVIKFTRSSRYFKPGLPYVLEIDVYKANGEVGPALSLTVNCTVDTPSQTGVSLAVTPWGWKDTPLTDSRGKLSLEYSIPADVKNILFKVSPTFATDDRLSHYYFQARPFYSPSAVYMQVHAMLTSQARRGSKPRVGDYVTVYTQYSSSEDISTVQLVVLSKGRIVWQARTLNIMGNSTVFHLVLSQDMSPGARILAFATRGHDLGAEVISDSVWIDVEGQCEAEVSLSLKGGVRSVLRPGQIGTVQLSGQPHTQVGIIAVDNAVYHLKNNSLTRDSLFQTMLSHDRGCGCGSGKDTAKVFENAGLTVLTNAGLDIPTKLAEGCVDKTVRRKRRAKNNREKVQSICCLQGAKMENASLALCYHISQKLREVLKSTLCAREFLRCCRGKLKGRLTLDVHGRVKGLESREPEGLDLSLGLDDDVSKMAGIPLRSNFPESWWFEEYNLGPAGKADVDFVLPDSITTWLVQAVGVSPRAGLCVAPPLALTTFSSFFVQLDLPYSVVRLEQVEIRATVYNYMSRRIRVNLVLQSTDGVCYSGQPGKATEMVKLEIDPNDAGSAYFPIVPLEIGEFPIRVMAFSSWGRDAVEKTLRVVGEGLEKVHTVSIMLDPSGKRFLGSRSSNHSFALKSEVAVAEKRQSVELDLDLPADVIPDTDSCTVHAMGDLLGPTVHVLIEGVTELLRLPTGCGEQNLIYLAPNVYVMRYLRATHRLSASVEKKARTLIRQGVARQMTFRKPDGSFGTWPHADSSTWLTAFAMKTLCQAEHYVTVDHNQTCSSMAWLHQQQHSNGSYAELAWVTHREMLGGINGDVSHAAFILIALLECDCKGMDWSEMIDSTVRYIEQQVDLTDRPLAVAASAYALTLAGSPDREPLVKRMMTMAKSSTDGFTFWPSGSESDYTLHKKPFWHSHQSGALEVEVTSYALLTILARGDLTTATNVVGWLLQRRNSHGAFISTQDTVIGLQALSEYSIKSYSSVLDMTCHIRSEVDDRFRKSISLTPEDAMVLKSVPKVPTGGKLHFEAKGTGVGLMQVDVRFNVPEDREECRFEVKVTTHQHNTLLQTFFGSQRPSKCEPCDRDCVDENNDDDEEDEEDFENFTFPPIVPRIQTLWYKKSGIHPSDVTLPQQRKNETRTPVRNNSPWGSRIGRPRRSVVPYSSEVVCIEVCVRFLGSKTTGMSVVDAGLFTGYSPITEDLEALKLNGDIDHFEKSQRSVVLYVDEIFKTMKCFKFRARQDHMAENIQPAKVQVYDYYNPGDRCTVFYKSNSQSGQLVNFCDRQKQICQCLESRCTFCEESWHGLGWMDLMKFACSNASYVLEVKALDRDLEKAGFERLLADIVSINTQRGPHVLTEGMKVILLKRSSCYCPRITPGKTYLMMLPSPKRFKDGDGKPIYAFLLDKTVFVIEQRKPQQKGLSGSQRSTAKNVRRTVRRLRRRGCDKPRRPRTRVNPRRSRRGKQGRNRKKT